MLVGSRKHYSNLLTTNFGDHMILAIRNSIDQSHYSPDESGEIQPFGTNVFLSPKYVWNANFCKILTLQTSDSTVRISSFLFFTKLNVVTFEMYHFKIKLWETVIVKYIWIIMGFSRYYECEN